MPLLYHAYVYLEFLILACTIYILAPLNFIMAYPLQILVVGPFCRFIFRHLFASTNQGNESKVENEMEQQGFAE